MERRSLDHVSGSRAGHLSARFILCIIATLCSQAMSQWFRGGEKEPPVEIVKVDFGWDGVLPAERFGPVVVWLQSSQGAFAGRLSISYQQDATQEAELSIPVSTTPNVAVPFELAACVPERCERITVRVANGEFMTEQRFASFARRGELPMPRVETPAARILMLGDMSAKGALRKKEATPTPVGGEDEGAAVQPSAANGFLIWQGNARRPREGFWDGVERVNLEAANLARNWMAYQGIDLIIAPADRLAGADPRAIAAINTWVEAGGRLLLLADGPGPAVFRCVLHLNGSDLFLIEEVRPIELSRDVRTELSGQPDPPRWSLPGRTISLTPHGVAQGWRLAWDVDNPTGRGVLAYGPVGLGIVGVLGCDPERMPAVLSAEPTAKLWRNAIERTMPEHIVHASSRDDWRWRGVSPIGIESSRALGAALDTVAGAPPIGIGVFISIALAMLMLVGLIGPLDGLVLRRRGWGAKSHAIAVAWIAAACFAAYAAPRVVRSGESVYRVHRCWDVVCDEKGNALTACSTWVAGMFGGRPASVGLEGIRAGTWARGIAALYDFERAGLAFSPLSSVVQNAEDDPDIRQCAPRSVSQGQWTFRAMLGQEPSVRDGAAIGAVVEGDGEGFDVEVLRVPRGVSIEHAELWAAGKLWSVKLAQDDNGTRWRGRTWDELTMQGNSRTKDLPENVQGPPEKYPEPGWSSRTHVAWCLPGPRSRTDAMACGPCGVLTLVLAGQEPSLAFRGVDKETTTETGMVRVKVPIDGDVWKAMSR